MIKINQIYRIWNDIFTYDISLHNNIRIFKPSHSGYGAAFINFDPLHFYTQFKIEPSAFKNTRRYLEKYDKY
jgi:hypothetical protein